MKTNTIQYTITLFGLTLSVISFFMIENFFQKMSDKSSRQISII